MTPTAGFERTNDPACFCCVEQVERADMQTDIVALEEKLRDTRGLADECPITCCAMVEPVVCIRDGRTYEAEAIKRWVRSRGQSPV